MHGVCDFTKFQFPSDSEIHLTNLSSLIMLSPVFLQFRLIILLFWIELMRVFVNVSYLFSTILNEYRLLWLAVRSGRKRSWEEPRSRCTIRYASSIVTCYWWCISGIIVTYIWIWCSATWVGCCGLWQCDRHARHLWWRHWFQIFQWISMGFIFHRCIRW